MLNLASSGKSSVLSAVLGILPYEGSIKINGREVREMDPQNIRQHIENITQEPLDLAGTVHDNLFIYEFRNLEIRGPVHHEVTAFLLAELDILDAIINITYDTPFSQLRLSYGQRQGLSIARTTLHKLQTSNGILLMDDACGRIDEQAAEIYRGVVSQCFDGTTRLIVETADTDLELIGLEPLPAPEEEEVPPEREEDVEVTE